MSAQVGRGDLLRALTLGCAGPLALDHTDTVWWGYVPPLQDVAPTGPSGEVLQLQLPRRDVPIVPTPAPARARSALRMPEVWVAERLDGDSGEASDAPASSAVLTAIQLQPVDEPQAAYRDLLPLPRLARPLSAQLRQPQAAGLNIAALVRASTRRHWPRRLPRLHRQAWPATLIVLLDVGTELFPYRHDMYRVVALLEALVPRAQLRVLTGAHGPFGPWQTLRRQQGRASAYAEDGLRPQSGHSYLVLSDLGLLRPASELARAWQAWLADAQARQCVSVALAPVAAEDVNRELASAVRLLRWSPDSRLQPESGRPEADHSESDKIHSDLAAVGDRRDSALRELLGCLSATLRMDPPLLRALRQSGSTPQDASLEGRLWAHPDVRSTTYACLRQPRIEFHRTALRAQSGTDWSALKAICSHHHAHWPMGMRVVEGMQQLSASPLQDSGLLQQLRNDLNDLAHSLRAGGGNQGVLDVTADYVLHRAPAEARTHLGQALDALAQASGRPTGLRQRWCLLQRGTEICVVPATDLRPSGPGVVLCSDLGQAAPGELVRIAQFSQPAQYLPLPAEGMLVLPTMTPGTRLMLGGEETRLMRRQRTRGVWGWRQSDEGVIETLDLPVEDGHLDFRADAWLRSYVYGRGRARRLGAGFYYIDRDAHGAFLELQCDDLLANGYPGNLPLRFRYLEPATFLQGSPEGIGDEDEHPQHPVTLTQGVWLAETPCTQALWQAVIGENPSHFDDGADAPRRPVENVSWGDVTAFLKRLQPLLPPGCEAVLPTESQWEYACRAGTQTAYWWGDEADDRCANWNEQNSGTTPVDRYPPNPWGLYDMHGNVWEWCADGTRNYAAKPARDPQGPGAGERRVVRGGSWIFHPGIARAAYRDGRHRRYAFRSLGFRFALRSSGGPEARPGGPGASRRGGAAEPHAEGASSRSSSE